MDLQKRIERSLERAMHYATAAGQPPKITKALMHSVFPGGARVRPRLCLATALASGDANPRAADAAATAIELLHCASLVHDDLPVSMMPRFGAGGLQCRRHLASLLLS